MKVVFETSLYKYLKYDNIYIRYVKGTDGEGEMIPFSEMFLQYMLETQNELFMEMSISYIEFFQKAHGFNTSDIVDLDDMELLAESLYLQGQELV